MLYVKIAGLHFLFPPTYIPHQLRFSHATMSQWIKYTGVKISGNQSLFVCCNWCQTKPAVDAIIRVEHEKYNIYTTTCAWWDDMTKSGSDYWNIPSCLSVGIFERVDLSRKGWAAWAGRTCRVVTNEMWGKVCAIKILFFNLFEVRKESVDEGMLANLSCRPVVFCLIWSSRRRLIHAAPD